MSTDFVTLGTQKHQLSLEKVDDVTGEREILDVTIYTDAGGNHITDPDYIAAIEAQQAREASNGEKH